MATRRDFLKAAALIAAGMTGIAGIAANPAKSEDLKQNTSLESRLSLDKRYNYSEEDLKKYDSWIDQTIEESKKDKSYAVIINKSDYSLTLIKDGKFHSKYNVELGPNPFDDKKMEGDGCTPEGMYSAAAKKDIGSSTYHRAFLVSYPNALDYAEFKEMKKKGIVPNSASIGGMIEIHGNGSGMPGNKGGYNWTLGCVAMSDEDIDKIFQNLKKDSKITIVKYASRKIN